MPETLEHHKNEVVLFAETNFRNERRKFGIKTDDRRRHMYLVGKTGMGKSVTLENLIFNDIQAGHGLAVVDPHGDLAEKILDFIPSNRINDVVYLNPSDMDYPVAFNILEKVDPHYRHLVASGLIGVFKKIWADSWGPRLEYVLRNAILALLDYQDSTLLGVNRMFIDKEYRKKVIAKIQDPVVKAFWAEEFSKYNQQFMVEAIAPIQNKVGQFLSTSLIRNVVGQAKSTIDIRKIMDEGKILIMNLAKGRIGEDSSGLMGAMMITKVQLAAMSRVDIPENKRKDFYLYVDEFQNFATESFANILSEARKYHLNLILAHQYIEQLNEVVKPAVFGNVGTMVVFRVGAADAEELVKEFTPRFIEEDLVNLPKYNVYMKLMIDGIASDPFSATTLPPVYHDFGNRDKVIAVSRERYAKPREVVEDKIRRWSGLEGLQDEEEKEEVKTEIISENVLEPVLEKSSLDFIQLLSEQENKPEKEIIPEEKNIPENKVEKKEEVKQAVTKLAEALAEPELFNTKCDSCGRPTQIKFKPDGVRPVYCKDCLKKARRNPASPAVSSPKSISPQIQAVKPTQLTPIDRGGAKTISLSEAIGQKPVLFHNAKPKPADVKEEKKAPVNATPPQMPRPEAKSVEIKPPAIPSSRYADDGKKINPGEIINLD
jgi:CxxC-x17-CxxC domain-containing protein